MKINYVKCGDVRLPDFALPEPPDPALGKYGRLRLAYVQKHQSGTYTAMLLDGSLNAHIAEVDKSAREMLDTLIPRMTAAQGVTEALKATDQMEWVGRMNNIKASAEEIVLADLIFD